MYFDTDHFFSGSFTDFSPRWYLIVGEPLTMIVILQIFFPHFSLILNGIMTFFNRCMDRSCTFNRMYTKKVAQKEYENLYIGPQFILQVRLAQMLTIVFVCMIFGSGIPMLYVITWLSFIITYWTDKILILRYYRKTDEFDEKLTKKFVSVLPWSIILHIIVGWYMYSYPYLLTSEVMMVSVPSYLAEESGFLNDPRRYETMHMQSFSSNAFLIILLLLF